jgi:hypothetical protein
MGNEIKCPNCKKTISDNPLIDSAAKGEGLGSQFILCECGERLSFWAITAQLRDQKKPGARIQNWLRSFSKD